MNQSSTIPNYEKNYMYYLTYLQLKRNKKDFDFQLHHRLSKFEVTAVVNLKHIFQLFGLYTTCFLIQKLLELIRSSSDGQFWRKSQNKKGGKFESRSYLYYYNCTEIRAIKSHNEQFQCCADSWKKVGLRTMPDVKAIFFCEIPISILLNISLECQP